MCSTSEHAHADSYVPRVCTLVLFINVCIKEPARFITVQVGLKHFKPGQSSFDAIRLVGFEAVRFQPSALMSLC